MQPPPEQQAVRPVKQPAEALPAESGHGVPDSARPQEVGHPLPHVYRVFNDVCVRRVKLDPKIFEKHGNDNFAFRFDRVLYLCRSHKDTQVEWPMAPRGPAPERTHHPKDWVMGSRFQLQNGGPECGSQSFWLGPAIYLHAGHKITARWPLTPKSLNMAHWMSDAMAPLLVAAATLNSTNARPPEALIVDAEAAMPPNALKAAGILSQLFADSWNRSVPLVHARNLPEVTCMQQLVLPDNVVEMRLSGALPEPTTDGTGRQQPWSPSYGQPGPGAEIARAAVDAYRSRALGSCGIAVERKRCLQSAAVFGREGDKKRQLLNTEALVLGLQSEGLEVQSGFDFAALPWCDTLRIMSSIDIFVSLHGANVGFNVFYMQPDAIVMELFPNSSHGSLLTIGEQKLYRRKKGHWSQNCPWDYFTSLNLYQSLSLYYKCQPARLPRDTEEDQPYPANYPCKVCVPCVVKWVRMVGEIRQKKASQGMCA